MKRLATILKAITGTPNRCLRCSDKISPFGRHCAHCRAFFMG